MKYEIGKSYWFTLKQTNSSLKNKSWESVFGVKPVYKFTLIEDWFYVFENNHTRWYTQTVFDYCDPVIKKYKEMEEWL